MRRLGVLRELDRRGSLAEAAKALHLTPSAVSQQLATLSREVGVPLIERQGRGVRLTGQARVLLRHADLIAAQLEEARADLAAWEGGRRGAVTIGSFSSAITGLIPAVLRRLAEHHPEIGVKVVEAEPPDLFTRLDAGEIDIAVAVDFAAAPPHTDRRYTRLDLLVDVLDLALPATHRHAHRSQVPLRDLATDTWIAGDPRSCCGAVTRSLCAANGFTPHIGHAVNDWQSLAALVEAGAGVALVPRLVQPLHRPNLVFRPPTGPPPTRHVFAAVRAGSGGAPILAAVLNHLQAAATVTRSAPVVPTTVTAPRAREMNLYRRYFDLVANGTKTIEVRVQYPNLRNLKAGDHIRFVCGHDDALTRVRRVAHYASFEAMLDSEDPERVNPASPRDRQLSNIRRIYGPEKEALGVLAIEIELVDVPTA